MVKISRSNAGGAGSIPGQGTKIPHASWSKYQNINNRSNAVTNSLKTFKVVHIFKKSFERRSLLNKKIINFTCLTALSLLCVLVICDVFISTSAIRL